VSKSIIDIVRALYRANHNKISSSIKYEKIKMKMKKNQVKKQKKTLWIIITTYSGGLCLCFFFYVASLLFF